MESRRHPIISYINATEKKGKENSTFKDKLTRYAKKPDIRPFDDRNTVFKAMNIDEKKKFDDQFQADLKEVEEIEKGFQLPFRDQAEAEHKLKTLRDKLKKLTEPMKAALREEMRVTNGADEEKLDLLAEGYIFKLFGDIDMARTNENDKPIYGEFHRLLRNSINADNIYDDFRNAIKEEINRKINQGGNRLQLTLLMHYSSIDRSATFDAMNTLVNEKNVGEWLLDLYSVTNKNFDPPALRKKLQDDPRILRKFCELAYTEKVISPENRKEYLNNLSKAVKNTKDKKFKKEMDKILKESKDKFKKEHKEKEEKEKLHSIRKKFLTDKDNTITERELEEIDPDIKVTASQRRPTQEPVVEEIKPRQSVAKKERNEKRKSGTFSIGPVKDSIKRRSVNLTSMFGGGDRNKIRPDEKTLTQPNRDSNSRGPKKGT